MNYGDFSSVVQLGVSLHLGTALLQFYGDLGVQPLIRILDRIKGLFAEGEHEPLLEVKTELEELESDFQIFKIRLFNEYRKYVIINSAVAVALTVVLIVIAFLAETKVGDGSEWVPLLIVLASILPAPATLFCLWKDASRILRPLIERADAIEDQVLKSK